MLTREPFEGLTIKTALVLGFVLTFGIWLFAGSYFTNRIDEVERRAGAINARYMQAQELLSTVRAQVILGSVDVRDALIEPDIEAAADYREHLEQTYQTVSHALHQYVPVLDSPAERERVARLQAEIDGFYKTMLQVLATDARGREARALLRSQIVPKRELVIRVSDEAQALNRSAFVQEQREIASLYNVAQRRLWESLGIALVASFGLGLLATVHAARLQHRIREQQLRDTQNARELQELSRKLITAQEEERRSIARELHDEVGQVLTTIKVELAVAQRAIVASGGDPDLLADARSITDGALSTVRDLSHLLHPALLDDMGLPAAVEWYLRGFGKRHGIRTDVVLDRMEGRLTPEIETSAYRIIQEAVTNVAKHAAATVCRVHLQRLPLAVQITIEDNGIGFDPEEIEQAERPSGLGLVGIRERASRFHGLVRIESAPGHGTKLTVELPARSVRPDEVAQRTKQWPAPVPAREVAVNG